MIVARLISLRNSEVVVQPEVAKFLDLMTFPVLNSIYQFQDRRLLGLEIGDVVDIRGDTLDRGVSFLELPPVRVVMLRGGVKDGLK